MLRALKRDERFGKEVLKNTVLKGFPCLTADMFCREENLAHLFTTRLGGVSQGIYTSCNLSFNRGDDPDAVSENYRRVAEALGCEPKDMVATRQTHTTNIRVVTKEDMGKGIVRDTDYEDVDGLMTNIPGICLSVFTADCVPILFYDPVNKAIGAVHSGWRGTVGEIGPKLIGMMEKHYGTDPEKLLAVIGPSICQECYEVSEDVAAEFIRLLAGTESIREQILKEGNYDFGEKGLRQAVEAGVKEGKYQLDLWLANKILLCKNGMKPEHVAVTDVCTCHNPNLLFSHRASEGKRGNLGAFLMMKSQK